MLDKLFDIIVAALKSEDSEKSVYGIDLIAPLSYATQPDQLTTATKACLLAAKSYKGGRCPDAVLAFTNCTHSGFAGCIEREDKFKRQLLGDIKPLSAPPCNNSVLEAESIRDVLWYSMRMLPKRILIICGEIHSRSARCVWEQVFPQAEIIILCIPHRREYQTDFPLDIMRHRWRYLFMSIAKAIVTCTIGINLMRRFHHQKQ